MSSDEPAAIILAIDIGKNSLQQDLDGKTFFEKSIICASMTLKRKILAESIDHLALILFGSSQTKNHLSSQGCCYDNIEIVNDLSPITWNLFKSIKCLSPTNITPSDWISTFVLAADLLKNETKKKIFSSLRVVMFSNLATDIAFGNIDIIAACLKTENINLTIIGKDCEVIKSLNPAFDVFIKKTEATAVNFEQVMPKLSYYKHKGFIKTSWNAPLSWGDVFDIKVFGFKKIDVTTKSSDWLFSKNHEKQYTTTVTENNFAKNAKKIKLCSEEMQIDEYYHNDKIFPSIVFTANAASLIITDEALGGWEPLHTDVETSKCSFEVHSPRCLQVLGFVKSAHNQSSFLIEGASHIFKPHKQDIIAFNAIFNSMLEKDEVLLVRKVDLNIQLLNIAALFPQKEDDEKCFVYVNIPYVESEPLFTLPSLDSICKHLEKKTINYPYKVEDIDGDGCEFVMPDYKFDPSLQSLYDYIVRKLSPEGLDLMNPAKIIVKNNEEFKETFSVKQESSETCSEVDDKHFIQFICDKELKFPKTCVITELTPIEDFKKNLKNGLDPAIVCRKMQYIILNLIEGSKNLEDLIKPVSALKALRQYYTAREDVKSYNHYIHIVRKAFLITGNESMWSKFIDSRVGLITNNEIETSDISQESAEEFKILSGELDPEIMIDDDNPLKPFL